MDPGIPRPDDFESGDPLSADSLNEWAAHVSGSPTYPGGGLHSASGASGSMMRLALPRRPIMALLSGSSSPYSWTQKVCTAAGTLATGPLSGTNAYETNSTASLGGNTVRLFPDGMGGWWFTSKCCTASCTGTLTVNVKCGGVNVASATVTITQGATSYSGSTNAAGNATFTPGISGTWDITVSKSGLTTYTSTFSWSCTTATVNVAMSSPSNVVSGNVKGCNTTGLSGVSVTLKQGATTLGTATTDASGNFSITFAWSSGSLTLECTRSRFNNFTSTSFTPSGCNLTTTVNPTMTAATGYRCANCSGATPISETLYNTTPSGHTVTMTYQTPMSISGDGWEGTETINGRIFPDCSSGAATTGDFEMHWFLYPVLSAGQCALFGQTYGCSALPGNRAPVAIGVTPVDGIHGYGGISGVVVTTSPFTMTYNHSYRDADFTLISGSGTITE